MRLGIIDRYILKETALTFLAVVAVLLLLILGMVFARFLGDVAADKIPREIIFRIVGFTALEYLKLLVPVALMLGIMLTLGRMYQDNEMSAISAAGIGLRRLYRPIMVLTLLFVVVSGLFSLVLTPAARLQVEDLRHQGREALKFEAFEPGRFRSLLDGQAVLYTESVSDEGIMHNIFIRLDEEDEAQDVVIIADRGVQREEQETGQQTLVLWDGYRFQGNPGQPDYRIIAFAEHGVQMTPARITFEHKIETKTTLELFALGNMEAIGEFHGRLASPLMVLLLALIAVPLAHMRPRQGRYGRLVAGLLVFLAYANMVEVAKSWLEDGLVPPWLGLWWVHLTALGLLFFLIARRNHRLRLRSLWRSQG